MAEGADNKENTESKADAAVKAGIKDSNSGADKMTLEEQEILPALEAVLFASGEPVAMEQLAEIFEMTVVELQQHLSDLDKSLEDKQRGIQLQQVAGGYQLVTRPRFFQLVERLTETRDKRLSAAAMETLSIIAFKQPITKQEIEHIRGVRAEKVVLKLLEQDLIKELGRKDTSGRPILYGTTDTFLKCFGLNNLTDLPELPQADMSQLSPEQLEYLEQKVPEPADKEV